MHALLRKFPPSVIALLLQCVAFLLLWLLAGATGLQGNPLFFALLCGLIAALLSRFAGMARWWLPIQFLFVPLLVLMLALDISPGVYLAAFIVLLLVYWSTFSTQVPLYLSSDKVMHALEGIMAERQVRFVDLGSGLGGVLLHLARAAPAGHYSGVESAPLPFLWSWLRIKLGGYRNCTVRWGSIWDDNLAQYDMVYAYLSPVPMERLWLKVRAEMRPGTLFVSSSFAVPEQSHHRTVQVDDLHRSTLMIWHM